MGVSSCSQSAAATRPKAKPATCDANAAANEPLTKTTRSSTLASIESALPWPLRWSEGESPQAMHLRNSRRSALRARCLIEGRAQAPGLLQGVVICPEVKEDDSRLLRQHVTVDRRHV